LAFHPNYARNGFFYVYYSRKIDLPDNTVQLRSRISRFTRSSDNSNKADKDSEVVFMEFKQLDGITKAFHKAGDLHFGPDGYLYIASGDGAGDAQSFGNLGGKLLRIDVDQVPDLTNAPDCDVSGKRNYRIPSGNAFTNGKGNGCDEIYVLGLRNPWRFSFDRTNGNIWVSDVGSHNNNITGYIASEEINFIAAGTRGGINLGWPCYEGNKIGFPEKTATGCKRDYLFPVYSYNHQDPDIYTSIIGGYVYRGKDSPDLIGKYLFANLTSSFDSTIQILSGPLTRPNVVELSLAGKVDLLTTFGEDFRGELYIAGNGGIYKVGGTNLP
jgi:glucose/arabinose dehydrogenase